MIFHYFSNSSMALRSRMGILQFRCLRVLLCGSLWQHLTLCLIAEIFWKDFPRSEWHFPLPWMCHANLRCSMIFGIHPRTYIWWTNLSYLSSVIAKSLTGKGNMLFFKDANLHLQTLTTRIREGGKFLWRFCLSNYL